MRIYPLEPPPTTGDTFTPRELITEARTIHGEFNGRLDADNFPTNFVTTPSLAVDAIAEHFYESYSDVFGIAVASNALPTYEYGVPSTLGGDWTQVIETTDCVLVVEARATVNLDACQFYLKVDGQTIARKDFGNDTSRAAVLKGVAIVGAGSHVVEFVFTRPLVASIGATVDFAARALSIRQVKR